LPGPRTRTTGAVGGEPTQVTPGAPITLPPSEAHRVHSPLPSEKVRYHTAWSVPRANTHVFRNSVPVPIVIAAGPLVRTPPRLWEAPHPAVAVRSSVLRLWLACW